MDYNSDAGYETGTENNDGLIHYTGDVSDGECVSDYDSDSGSSVWDLNRYTRWLANGCNERETEYIFKLFLSHGLLSQIPPEISKFKNLTQLDLFYNELTSLPQELGTLTKLRKLLAFKNRFETFPIVICELKNLVEIDLSGNHQIFRLPPEIRNLKKLENLFMLNTGLSILPPEIGELERLMDLRIDNNKLETLPPQIGHLRHLRLFSADDNNLTVLPDEMCNLTTLRLLFIKSNQLQSYPANFSSLVQRLETFEGEDNPVEYSLNSS